MLKIALRKMSTTTHLEIKKKMIKNIRFNERIFLYKSLGFDCGVVGSRAAVVSAVVVCGGVFGCEFVFVSGADAIGEFAQRNAHTKLLKG